jgi:ATP-dependent Clp protease ATP-binding subunit ClpC
VAYLAKDGFDPQYGARPLRRSIQRKVEDSLSEALVSGTLEEGDSVRMFMEDGKLDYTIQKKHAEESTEEVPVG